MSYPTDKSGSAGAGGAEFPVYEVTAAIARFPRTVRAINTLPCRSCMIDGEVVARDETGMPVFKLLRRGAPATLYAFDLLELDGKPLNREPIETRKAALAKLIGTDRPGLLLSQAIEAPADVAFAHICKLGLEGIVSKRLGVSYESGRSVALGQDAQP